MLKAYRGARAFAKGKVKNFLSARRGYGLGELRAADLALKDASGPPRLNLVMIGIGKSGAFGGSATALRFFEALRPHFQRARVLSLDEDEHDFVAGDWPNWTLQPGGADATQSIRFLGANSQLDVEPNDYFIATHWRTAHYVQDMIRALVSLGRTPNSYAYLIQDYEPGFYAWSGRYVLSNATYADTRHMIPVINTQLLADFFSLRGFSFESSYVFEPNLNPTLARFRPQAPTHKKTRTIIVYGRPNSPRNAFDVVVESLRIWSQIYPSAPSWRVFSLGESHPNIPLHQGLALESKGKMSLEEYAHTLLDASVGLSLMISPHPSYPPMEMAEFGVRVVTNDFANKRLGERSPNITGASIVTPQALAQALVRCCNQHDAPTSPREFGPVFQEGSEEFSFVDKLARDMINPPLKSDPAALHTEGVS
jgi:O-antigen biosynthesis protein